MTSVEPKYSSARAIFIYETYATHEWVAKLKNSTMRPNLGGNGINLTYVNRHISTKGEENLA
jgi:hypothetical protein